MSDEDSIDDTSANASIGSARAGRLLRTLGLSLSIGCCALLVNTPAAAADLVTRATDLADQYGDGLANWRTLAIMHRAMHDAANAVFAHL